MDRVGLDAAYRQSTGCTLYTVEMHLHYLQEVKQSDTAVVTLRILGLDAKRIHAAFELLRAGHTEVAAAAEVMLLHVRQHEGTVRTAPFPPAESRGTWRAADRSRRHGGRGTRLTAHGAARGHCLMSGARPATPARPAQRGTDRRRLGRRRARRERASSATAGRSGACIRTRPSTDCAALLS